MAEHVADSVVDREEKETDSNKFILLDDSLSDKDKDENLTDFMARFKASKDHMEKLYPAMLENYKRYRSIADPILDEFGNEVKGRSNLYVPYPWAITESELPRLAGRLPKVRAFPRNRTERTKTQSIQDLIYSRLHEAVEHIQDPCKEIIPYSFLSLLEGLYFLFIDSCLNTPFEDDFIFDSPPIK